MINIAALKEEQRKLAEKVVLQDSQKKYEIIAGVDQAYINDSVVAGIVVCDSDFNVIEKQYATFDSKIKYISGLLFYKDGLAVIEAYNKLKTKPELLFVQANGILHERRFGMASQLGVLLDVATIGVAKKKTLGEVREGTIYDSKDALGYEVHTREYAKPLYVSPGHKVSLKTSALLCKQFLRHPHKLPEPLHIAHKYTAHKRKELLEDQK